MARGPGLGLLGPAHHFLQRAAFAVFPVGAASGGNLPDDSALQAVRFVPCFEDVAVMREPIQRMRPGITPLLMVELLGKEIAPGDYPGVRPTHYRRASPCRIPSTDSASSRAELARR